MNPLKKLLKYFNSSALKNPGDEMVAAKYLGGESAAAKGAGKKLAGGELAVAKSPIPSL